LLVGLKRNYTNGMKNRDDLKRQLESLLPSLSHLERRILTLRFGLDGERIHTLNEVCGVLEIEPDDVRYAEKTALKKLRQSN
jgi:RNA polymerase primary sigma factor